MRQETRCEIIVGHIRAQLNRLVLNTYTRINVDLAALDLRDGCSKQVVVLTRG